ncbi:hypothetical protein FACS1894187_20130 [Synergistales bacterium]|nr:hypothetical protein FACS1894187_20130 [Synergistales bacterium]
MTTNITELVFILDRSGSMGGLESDTIGGFNSMLKKQQAEPGEARLTTVLFDDRYEALHDRLDLKAVSPITDKEYYVRGSTALLDAIGKTIRKIVGVQRHTAPDYRADKVLFVITTDGLENASRKYTAEQVKSMIEEEKEKYGWEFIFLGANIDAVETARNIGISEDMAHNYHADSVGLGVLHESVAGAVASFRGRGFISKGWSAKIDEDFKRRKSEKK